jgi:HicB family
MARYALNLPTELKREAEELAKNQGVSLNQFILWSVSEKVGALKQALDDPNFPGITYRRGA